MERGAAPGLINARQRSGLEFRLQAAYREMRTLKAEP